MPEAPWSASLLEAACQGGRLLCHPAIAAGRASPVPGSCASPSNHPDGLPARKLGGGAEGALGCRAFPGTQIITCMAVDKRRHAQAGDILVDDTLKHRHLWEEAGGTFVHHRKD